MIGRLGALHTMGYAILGIVRLVVMLIVISLLMITITWFGADFAKSMFGIIILLGLLSWFLSILFSLIKRML